MTTRLANLTPEQMRALLADKLKQKTAAYESFPASSAQERMWFLDQLEPGSIAYNIPSAARIRGELDMAAWHAAVADMVARHRVLRTTFALQGGSVAQMVHPTLDIRTRVIDLSDADPRRHEQLLADAMAAEFGQPFDLARGPLVRFTMLRFAPGEHVLLLTLHHIAADLWAATILFGELLAAYRARCEGHAPQLSPIDVQYTDYSVWQRRQLDNHAWDGDADYWTTELAGAPRSLELPTDHPRPLVRRSAGSSVPVQLDPEVLAGVRELAVARGTTSFVVLLAAFDALLWHYSRQDDIIVGVPVANRQRPELAGLVGYFSTMVPLRARIAPDEPMDRLIETLHATSLAGFDHQNQPFDRIVEALAPERDTSRTPLFQVSFVYQNIPLPDLAGAGLSVVPLEVGSHSARFDLELQLMESDGVRGRIEFSLDLFDERTVERLARDWESVVAQLVAEPGIALADLRIGAGQELGIARNEQHWEGPLLTHPRVVQRALEDPDRPAVRMGESTLTRAELVSHARSVAAALAALGIGRGDVVGICLDRSPDLVSAVVGVMMSGAGFVPVDPQFPRARIDHMLTDSAARLVLSSPEVLTALGGLDAPVLDLADALAADPGQAPQVAVRPDDFAYVIYTSGSTGLPKGVVLGHAGLDNFLRSMALRPGLGSEDTLLAVTTLSFDISMLELLLPLTVGARIELADHGQAMDGHALADLFDRSGATVCQATPATWRMLLDANWTPRPGTKVLCGGEALDPGLAATLLGLGVDLWNMYGPTETTVWSSVWQVTSTRISLGEPVANTDLFIVDERGRVVPQGVPGELWIGGLGVAHGYLNRPELTAQRFVSSPVAGSLSPIAYRTGDLVRLRSDRSLEFLGRLDHQVKLRGHRIELGEIEQRLAAQPGVGQAVVVVQGSGADARLVAHLVPAADQPAADQWDESVDA